MLNTLERSHLMAGARARRKATATTSGISSGQEEMEHAMQKIGSASSLDDDIGEPFMGAAVQKK